ncbi:hypothetical protein H5410_062125, partial [Solanum commersonii]
GFATKSCDTNIEVACRIPNSPPQQHKDGTRHLLKVRYTYTHLVFSFFFWVSRDSGVRVRCAHLSVIPPASCYLLSVQIRLMIREGSFRVEIGTYLVTGAAPNYIELLLLLECCSDGRLSAAASRLEADAGQLAAVAGWLLPTGPLLVGRSLVNAKTPEVGKR